MRVEVTRVVGSKSEADSRASDGVGRCKQNQRLSQMFRGVGVSCDSLRSACCCAPALPCDDCSAFGR